MDEYEHLRLLDTTDRNFESLVRNFSWEIPALFNIAHATCDRHAETQPQNMALYCENEQGESTHINYGQLQRSSNQLANLLLRQNVNQGDRVGIVLPQCVETAVSHIAIHKLGAVSLPLSVLFGKDALLHRLRDSGAVALVTVIDRLPLILSLTSELPELHTIVVTGKPEQNPGIGIDDGLVILNLVEACSAESDEFTTCLTAADDPACLIYTSGTTGAPKGALIAHRGLLGNLPGFELSQDFFPKTDDVFYTPADWAWTGGLFDALLPTLFYGMPIVGFDYRKFHAETTLSLLQKYRVTCGFFPPTALKMLRTVPDIRSRYDLNLRVLMSGGEMLGEELLDWANGQLGVTVNEIYGQTEQNYVVGNCSAIMTPRPGSMGKVYPGHQVEIMAANGDICEQGETGEIVAHRDDAVHFLGYWQQSDVTASKYTDNWFHTGDMGFRDADGFLWFVGRADDVITSAGYRIGPGEIEDCILKHPAVQQVAVVGVADPEGVRGDIVKAYIVTNAGVKADSTLASEISNTVRSQLAAYEYPREIEFIERLPMTTTGKVRRVELRQRDHSESL